MSDVVILRGQPVELSSTVGHAFIVDATRAGEGLLSDSDLRDRYAIDDANWESIAKNPAVARAIRAASEQRIRSGQAAREAAAQHFVKAPGILNGIMSDVNASPRHRIEAAKEIRTVATAPNSEATAAAGTVFEITINLGPDHTHHYEFPITKQLPDKTIDADSNWGWKEVTNE